LKIIETDREGGERAERERERERERGEGAGVGGERK
jgi:hypothetical protein